MSLPSFDGDIMLCLLAAMGEDDKYEVFSRSEQRILDRLFDARKDDLDDKRYDLDALISLLEENDRSFSRHITDLLAHAYHAANVELCDIDDEIDTIYRATS
jgi:hypothetical protein